jgi:hypothetical protein
LGFVGKGVLQYMDCFVELVRAVHHLPAVQRQLVGHVTAALQGEAASSILHVAKCVRLLRALAGRPALEQELQRDLLAKLLGSGAALLHTQPEADVLALAEYLLGTSERNAWFGAFASACVRRPSKYLLLEELLRSPAVLNALELPAVQQLVEAYVATTTQLLRLAQPGQSIHSWSMPQASLPGYPQVGGWGCLARR